MKINCSPVAFIQNINKSTFLAANKLERSPYKDTVSFSAKKEHQRELKPRVQTAVNYSQEIMKKADEGNINLQDVSDITSKYSSNVKIHPMSELHRRLPNLQNYGAFFLAHMNEEFQPENKEMFVNLPEGNADEVKKLLFSMNCAHEFTHIEQMDTNEAFNQLKLMSRNNYEYAKTIMGIGDAIFEVFDTKIQAQTIFPIMLRSVNLREFEKYGEIVPVEAPVTRQMLPAGFGVKNEKEMQQEMKKMFAGVYEDVMVSISRNQPEILGMIPSNETYEGLMKKVRSYCAQKAKDERESYTTESEVAKKTLGITKSLNIDAFPIYYDILAKSFE